MAAVYACRVCAFTLFASFAYACVRCLRGYETHILFLFSVFTKAAIDSLLNGTALALALMAIPAEYTQVKSYSLDLLTEVGYVFVHVFCT